MVIKHNKSHETALAKTDGKFTETPFIKRVGKRTLLKQCFGWDV